MTSLSKRAHICRFLICRDEKKSLDRGERLEETQLSEALPRAFASLPQHTALTNLPRHVGSFKYPRPHTPPTLKTRHIMTSTLLLSHPSLARRLRLFSLNFLVIAFYFPTAIEAGNLFSRCTPVTTVDPFDLDAYTAHPWCVHRCQ